MKALCCRIFCCKSDKKLPLKSLDDQTRLLPKNLHTKNIFENNELHCYGLIPEEMKETFSLDKLIDKNDNVKKITAGNNHVLVLFASGKLGVIGDNTNGQLGLPFKKGESENKINEIYVYIPVIQDENFKKYEIIDIACGENFSLLLISANNKNFLFRLGYNQEDRYRDDIEKINPINLEKVDYEEIAIKKIFAYGQRSLFYTFKNEIYVGGLDFKMNPIRKYKLFHSLVSPIANIELGCEHCLILDERGNLYAIGDNTYGEIGIEDSVNTDKVKEVRFFDEKNLPKISRIAVGARHSLVLLKGGELYAFGDNSDGQCTGFSTRYAVPTKIIFDQTEKIIDIYCGYNHCMILLQNGDIYAWGDNTSGKLTLREVSQNVNHPKLLQILKGKNVNYIALGFETSIFSTSAFEKSIVFKETQPKI